MCEDLYLAQHKQNGILKGGLDYGCKGTERILADRVYQASVMPMVVLKFG